MFRFSISEETSSVRTAAGVRSLRAARLILSVLGVVVLLGAGKRGVAATDVSPDKAKLAEAYGKVPLSFEPNRGQTAGRVQFLSRGPGYGIFLTPGEAVLSFNKDKAAGQSVLQMKLVGANTGAAADAEDKLPGTANYMRGTDRSKWATGVPTYGKVRYAGVYPGVDLVFYGNQRELEYDFVVAPGHDAGKIALEFKGATPVVDAAGDLVLGAGGGAKFKKPVVYQMLGGERVAVAGAYEIQGQRVKFKLGKYDHSRELVIDPVVTYLTYLGGSLNNAIGGIAVDSSGAVYLTGSTSSTDFPLAKAYESSFPAGDTTMFVTKLNQSGTSLVYSTYLASNGNTYGQGLAVDTSGSAYVGGFTDRDGFPVTSGAFQTMCGAGQDASGNRINGCTGTASGDQSGVLAKLSADGSSIVYATYLGGNGDSSIYGVALDGENQAYVTGTTNSHCGPGPYSTSTYQSFQCFPTTDGSVQEQSEIPVNGQYGYAFLTKFDAEGATLGYSSILGPDPTGTAQVVVGYAVAVNGNDIAYITGVGGNTLYTTDGSFQTQGSVNGSAAFVAAFATEAQSLIYSTYLGGQNAPADYGSGIATDAQGHAYVTGSTSDCDFPTTTGAYETEAQYAPTDTANVGKCQTGFAVEMNPTGTALVWGTYIGSAPLTTGTTTVMSALALGADSSVYVAGATRGSGYPLENPVLPQQNFTDVAVVTHLSADGTSNLFSTTVGGSASAREEATGIAVDSKGAIYLAGVTNEQYLPTTNNVVQPAYAGTPGGNNTNGFVAKISPSTPPQPSNGLTQNLLANPGAELGSIADWTAGTGGTPTVDTGTFDVGINPHTGTYDFFGGANMGTDSLSQTVSIITQGVTAAQVDGGTLFANVSFWEQGLNQGSPSDDGSVALTFLNASNATISTVTIGPEDSHDGTWANVTGIPPIPVGTRSITYTMNFIRNQLQDNDAFIDDNVLSIHTNTGLTIFPGRLHFGNVSVGSQSASQTVSVTNQQTTTINIQQILSELGANPSDFLESDNCPSTGALVAGASCTLTITFVPDGVGPKSAGIAINTDSVPALQQVAVDGTGTGGILQVNPGNLKTIAGIGTAGDSGDDGQAIAAQLNQPNGVAFDPSGNLYIADDVANVIRKVDTTGKITTFAGIGTGGFAGDGGLATQAELLIPFSVASDKNGNIFIQDTGNYVIRKVDAKTGIITTVAGTPGTPGRSGDGGPATAAKLNENQGARFDSAGNFYVALCPTGTIRKIDTTGVITTVAGTPGVSGFSGDGGQATAAQLQCPSGVTIDAAGNFYIADEFNQVIRKVNTAGVISTIAGTAGVPGSSGDGGAATSATFNEPNDVVIDSLGNLYVADSGNNRVRKIDTNGVITTVAGGLNSAGSAAVNTPLAVTVDTTNNVYFSDSGNSKIEEIFPQGVQPFPATAVGSTSPAQTQTLSNIGNVDVTLAADGAFGTSGDAGDFTLSAGTCTGGAVLAANGGSCALSITFTPTAVGQRTLTVGIADNALNSPQSFSIGGLGNAAGSAVTPTITWATPAPITTATPLSATQLDATAADSGGETIPGTFVYTPAAGAMLAAGTQTLSVTFTPTDTTDFTTATKTVQIVVTQASGGTGTATSTTTTLTVTSGGSAVTTVASGSAVTLTAAVHAGANSVSPAQVAFCDASATSCTGIHVLAVAQVTEAGTAIYNFVPGLGAHSYRAVFLGTSTYGTSASATVALAVTGTYTTATTIAQSGTAGNFTLKATTVGAAPYPVQAATQSVTINLGQSAQNYVLTGTGSSTMNGGTYGNYYNTQGSCVTSGSTTTCDLTGAFTSSTPSFAAGTYDFQTIFTGSITSAVIAQTQYPVGTNEPNDFQYAGFAPSTTMTLLLNVTGGGAYTVPVVANGNFDPNLDNVGFADTSAVCGGTSLGSLPCQQDYVGTVVGATYTSTVTGAVQFEMPSPPTLVGPTGTIAFEDTSNSNAVLGTAVLGSSTPGFALAQAAGSPVTVGAKPYGMATGDLNGDGLVDLVVQNYGSGTVSVLLGKGDGTFQKQATYPVGVLPERVLLADLDGDGNLDMIVANTSSNTIGVLLGKGDGTFQAQVTYTCASPVGLGVMDINHDGIPDVVAGDYYANTMSVLLGKGDGTLKKAVTYATGNTPQTVAEGDFNGDGNIDVVVGNEGGATVGVFLGNGDGTFKAMVTYAVGKLPQGVQVGDFNGDGKQDLAVSNQGDGTISVLLGSGDGTFQPQVTYPVGTQPVGIAIADFNGDGIADITVNNTGSLTQGVLLGKGDGTFQPQVTFPAGNFPYGTTTGDFNGDGLPDIAAANYVDGTVTIFLSQATEAATAIVTGIAPAGTGTHTVVASYPGDVNYGKSVSQPTGLIVGATTTVITWTPTVGTIAYGTALGASQLNATAATAAGVAIPGTFVYTPAAGTVLTAGAHTLSVAFTPTSANYAAATGTVKVVVTPIVATVAWTPPAGIGYGTALSATQLDATATGLNAVALAGTFVYTPAAGAVLNAGTQTLSVTFTPTDVNYAAATGTVKLVVAQAASTVAWASPANIVYGTALSATQLDATATGIGTTALAGTFVYAPASGAVLSAGTQTLKVTFTPTSTNYLAATGSTTITVTQAAPVITWATPAGIAYGTPLSATQLDATVAGVSAGALPGTLVYTPALGTVLLPGTQTLNVAFTPTDAVDYTVAATNVQIVVGGPTLLSLTPAQAVIGSAGTTITLTGTGFVATSVVQANGTALATTYVNPTTLTAVIPAALLAQAGTLQVAVNDPSIEATSAAQVFTVLPIATSATLTGPSTTPPGSQPSVDLTITNPYPQALTAVFNLSFASTGSTPVDDPSIQFSSGGRSFSYVVAANSTTVPPVQLQAGTDAGTITIAVKLTADGLDVTPTGLAPLVIVVPAVVPVLSGTTVTRSGDTLTVVVHGFSNTREVSAAVFEFTAAAGDTLATPSLTIPATTIFGTWYSDAASIVYGSTFTYTQIFNTSGAASTVGPVKVTLTNSVGVSEASTGP